MDPPLKISMMDSRKRSSGSSIEAEDKASKRQRIINSTPDKLDSCIALQDWSPKQVYDILVESKIPKEEAELLKGDSSVVDHPVH